MARLLGRPPRKPVDRIYREAPQRPISARERAGAQPGAPHGLAAAWALSERRFGAASRELVMARAAREPGADAGVDSRLVGQLRSIFERVDANDDCEIDRAEMGELFGLMYRLADRELPGVAELDRLVQLEMACYDVLQANGALGFDEFVHWANQGATSTLRSCLAAGTLSMIKPRAVGTELPAVLPAVESEHKSAGEARLLGRLLSRAECLQAAEPVLLAELARRIRIVRPGPGSRLLEEGGEPGLGWVLEGTMLLSERSCLGSHKIGFQFAWPGDLFGHLDTLPPLDQRFQAVPMAGRCTLAWLDGREYQQLRAAHQAKADGAWRQQLLKMSWLRGTPPAMAAKANQMPRDWLIGGQIVGLMSRRRLLNGAVVAGQGAPLQGFCVVLSGRLTAFEQQPNGDVAELGRLEEVAGPWGGASGRQGDFYGEELLLSRGRPVVSEVSLTTTEGNTDIGWLPQELAPQATSQLAGMLRGHRYCLSRAAQSRSGKLAWQKYKQKLVGGIYDSKERTRSRGPSIR